jgi:hypothetical protein
MPPLVWPSTSSDLHFNGFRLGLFVLRQMDLQHAVLEFRADFASIGSIRQREAAKEVAIRTLDSMKLLVLLLFLELPFAGDATWRE